MAGTILIVEDEEQIVEICRDYLTADGFDVISAANGPDGLVLAHEAQPSLIVLDLMLPGLGGMEICRILRSESTVPIIMLTARHSEIDKLNGLNSGADDFMTKPFSPRELVARVHTNLRRVEMDTHPTSAGMTNVILDRDHFRVILPDGEIQLTPTEFDILSTLCSQPGQIFSRAELLNAARGVTFESYERSIDSHIRNLRRKIDRSPGKERHIITVHGFGYKFVV